MLWLSVPLRLLVKVFSHSQISRVQFWDPKSRCDLQIILEVWDDKCNGWKRGGYHP